MHTYCNNTAELITALEKVVSDHIHSFVVIQDWEDGAIALDNREINHILILEGEIPGFSAVDTTFNKELSIVDTVLTGEVNLTDAKFMDKHGSLEIKRSVFQKIVSFQGISAFGQAVFNNLDFHENVSFKNSHLSYFRTFWECNTFKKDLDITNAKFSNELCNCWENIYSTVTIGDLKLNKPSNDDVMKELHRLVEHTEERS